jgi:hypothetical protein
MRKTMLVVSLSVAVGVLVGAPATAVGQSPGDSVSGTTDDCIPYSQPLPGGDPCLNVILLRVDVASGPMGEHPAGTIDWDEIGPTPHADNHGRAEATCLSVRGQVAIIGWTGTWQPYGGFNAPYPLQVAGLIRVVDVGGPNSSLDSFQLVYADRGPYVPGQNFPPQQPQPPLAGPTNCSTFPGPYPTGRRFPFLLFPTNFTNETGDVVVTDRQPLPTSKDQCKNAGWKSFGVFKNQGDCVSFVATNGKNPPGGH